MTNAEKIRAMSDKKLAKWVRGRIKDCVNCPAFDEFCSKVTVLRTSCTYVLWRWLKQEADDDKS